MAYAAPKPLIPKGLLSQEMTADYRQMSTGRPQRAHGSSYNITVDQTRIGQYRIVRPIGSGGSANVFLARTEGTDGFSRDFAIKRVRAEFVGNEKVSAEIIAEARLAQRLRHGNIAQIFDLGEEAGTPYLVVEYVDGASLWELTREAVCGESVLTLGDSLYVTEQVAAALHYAHTLRDDEGRPAGIVHRDVNPKNILVSWDGVVKLADFGIATALTQAAARRSSTIRGTLGYLSPEQAKGDLVGAKSDQYSVGIILYELIAGHNPFAKLGLAEFVDQIQVELPSLPVDDNVDAALAAIVSRATATRPSDRYDSLDELRTALEEWRVAHGVRARMEGLRRTVRRIGGRGNGRLSEMRMAAVAVLEQGANRASKTRTFAWPAAEHSSNVTRWWILAGLGVIAVALAWWYHSQAKPDAAKLATAPDGEIAGAAGNRLAQDVTTPSDAATPVIATKNPTPAANADASVGESPTNEASATASSLTKSSKTSKSPTGQARRNPRERNTDRREPQVVVRDKGILKVNVLPYASVIVDGKLKGHTPLTVKLLPGRHTVVLKHPQTGRTSKHGVTVESNRTVSITTW